jgi:maltooligosyltrehalose trehalohydrolase
VDLSFEWADECWAGVPMSEYILYELHVGTFSGEGTFDGLIQRLPELCELGVTALEIMPVAQFPGTRNWGYDGAYLYSVQNSYGGLRGFKDFVNQAHLKGLAVVLDVVYNHLGPEGNYLSDYGPYFTDKYKTPWGDAINFDGPYSDEVRQFFIQNALFWIENCHVDGLRLDATHAIFDISSQHFLGELASTVKSTAKKLRRHVELIAETDLNDTRFVRAAEAGGLGMDAQWNDDFHHALLCSLPGADKSAYQSDYEGFRDLVKSMRDGYVFSGRYSPHRKKRHGISSRDISGERLVVFIQNHDQVGNDPEGKRLCHHVDFEQLKLAAGSVILAPYIPLLFMGEEYADTSPFQYFVDHGDPQLIEAVRKGRSEEFAHYFKGKEPPDPQDPSAYECSKLRPDLRGEGKHAVLLSLYQRLIALRKSLPPLGNLSKQNLEVNGNSSRKTVSIFRQFEGTYAITAFNFSRSSQPVSSLAIPGEYKLMVDSAAAEFGGPGSKLAQTIAVTDEAEIELQPLSFILLYREDKL